MPRRGLARPPRAWDEDKNRRNPRKAQDMQRVKSAQAAEIRALKRMKDREIDTTDIPPVLDWSKAVVGKFYRPIQKPLRIRLDADVLACALLRSSMERAGFDPRKS
jgi:uncharacterized protein (DUF4415 family)